MGAAFVPGAVVVLFLGLTAPLPAAVWPGVLGKAAAVTSSMAFVAGASAAAGWLTTGSAAGCSSERGNARAIASVSPMPVSNEADATSHTNFFELRFGVAGVAAVFVGRDVALAAMGPVTTVAASGPAANTVLAP